MISPRSLRKPARERASVLVVCLVLAALGTLGVAAWFSLLDARSHQVEARHTSLQRRAALMNGAAVARAALHREYLHGQTGLSGERTFSVADGKGEATLHPFADAPLTTTTVGPPSRNGAHPPSSYASDVAVDLANGAGEVRTTYRLRSGHPALGGALLQLHPPVVPADSAPLVSGNLRVKGRAVFWDVVARDLNNGIRADEFHLPNSIGAPTTFSTPSGTATLPLNYPLYLRTTGSSTPSIGLYRGELELLDDAGNPQNSYLRKLGPAPISLRGDEARSLSEGPPHSPPTSEDPNLLAYIAENHPIDITATLTGKPLLSSAVLLATVQKIPALTNRQLYQVFEAQTDLPHDALTALMATIDESTLTPVLDDAFLTFNEEHGADFNVNGKGTVTIYLDQAGVERILATDSTSAEAAVLPPLLLVVDNRSGAVNLERLELLHGNARPLILVVASSGATLPAAVFSGSVSFPDWRCIFDLQKTGLAFDVSAVAGVRLLGGIRGNHRLTVAGGSRTLERDAAAQVLAPLLSRDAWIETARN